MTAGSRARAVAGLVAALTLPGAGPSLLAQTRPDWRFFTSSDGLRESWAHDVTGGPTGRRWISHGAVDSLTVHDGYESRHLPSPGANLSVREGPTGQVWALLASVSSPGMFEGLQQFDGTGWRPHRLPPFRAPTQPRQAFLPWDHDRVAVLREDALVEFDGSRGRIRELVSARGLATSRLTAFTPEGWNAVWIGGEGLVVRAEAPAGDGAPVPTAVHRLPEAWRAAAVARINLERGGGLLVSVSARDGRALLRFADGRWELLASDGERTGFLEGWQGLDDEIWMVASTGRTFHLTVRRGQREWTAIEPTRLLSGRLSAVRPESEGVFWMATSLGVVRRSPSTWRPPAGLDHVHGHVGAMYQAATGMLYALHESNLLERRESGWVAHPLPAGFKPDVSFTDNLGELSDGRLVLGAYEGPEDTPPAGARVPLFDPRSGRFDYLSHPEGRLLQVVGAKSRGIWMVTTAGGSARIESHDGREFTVAFEAGPRWQASRLRSILERPGGELIVMPDGTGFGFVRAGVYRALTRADGYPGSGPFAVLDAGGGRLWLGDRDNVIEYDGRAFRVLRSGLQTVRTIRRTRDGTIWVGAGSGLHAFRDGSWLSMGPAEGLPEGAVYDVVETREGELWVSTSAGISQFHPDADREPPDTLLSAAENVREVPPSGDVRLVFRGRDRWNITAPERLLYSWRVDGGGWSPLQADAFASLRGLARGAHTVEVRAVDRNWNVDPTAVRFDLDVMRPWYVEPGFVAVSILGLLALAAAGGLFVSRHVRLERLVNERTTALADSNAQLRQELDDRRRVEEERARLESQLHQAQKLEAVGRLAGGIAHDFNNLLTVIGGYSELLRAGVSTTDDIRRLAADEIGKASDRAASLTRQLLTFGRHQVTRYEPLDLNVEIADIQRMLQRLIGEDIDLDFKPGPNLWPVMADRGQIAQVMVNLAVNARDAMPTGGKLTLETANVDLDDSFGRAHVGAAPGPHVQIAVTDTGVGMDAETSARIFEPFYTTKARGHGSGLGLATVYGIVRQAGGHIWVYSEPGRGTTFKVYLPSTAARPAPPPPAALPELRPHGDETILVVEDEEAVRTLAARVLKGYGYTVLVAGSAEQGEQLFDAWTSGIQLLVTDIVLTGASGPQLAERLVKRKPGLRVLFMSGYADDAVVRHGIVEGEMPFLQKPFTPEALAHKVRETLGPARSPNRERASGP
jgi:signal transduction histidine kinase/ActR/RegA family two-component response regulator